MPTTAARPAPGHLPSALPIDEAGVAVKVVPAEGKTHASLNEDLGKPDDVPTRVVFDFLQGVKK